MAKLEIQVIMRKSRGPVTFPRNVLKQSNLVQDFSAATRATGNLRWLLSGEVTQGLYVLTQMSARRPVIWSGHWKPTLSPKEAGQALSGHKGASSQQEKLLTNWYGRCVFAGICSPVAGNVKQFGWLARSQFPLIGCNTQLTWEKPESLTEEAATMVWTVMGIHVVDEGRCYQIKSMWCSSGCRLWWW